MKGKIQKMFVALLLVAAVSSCDMMTEDMSDCPTGLYITFRYDYNLERANMFSDHAGSVTLFVYDTSDRLVATYEESNTANSSPLRDVTYKMHISDLAPGSYRFLALAQQAPYSETMSGSRARFVRSGISTGDSREDLTVRLDRELSSDGTTFDIVNNSQPLDTLWHGMETDFIEVYAERPTYDTISLVRDTKKINVTLRELDDPTTMDIADYDLTITDRNSVILWDNSLDETDTVVYTPDATWNTSDRTDAVDSEGNQLDSIGRIGHADFMTSRIIYHDSAADDGILRITSRETGEDVAVINLPDILSRLRTSEDRYLYSQQEFLDRGYDYDLSVFLRGSRLAYITIEISVLGWSKRIQYEEL